MDLGWATVSGLPAKAEAAAAAPGLALIEQGVAQGGLRRPVEARLHLGIAQLAAGRREAARATFKALQAQSGSDPLSEVIGLWAQWAQAEPPLPRQAAGKP